MFALNFFMILRMSAYLSASWYSLVP